MINIREFCVPHYENTIGESRCAFFYTAVAFHWCWVAVGCLLQTGLVTSSVSLP